MLGKYAKAIGTVIFSAAGAAIVALGTVSSGNAGDVSAQSWLIAAGTVLGSGVIVAAVSNISGVAGGVAKSIAAAGSAGIAALVIALDDNHITQAEWLTAFVATVAATGFVYQKTNKT